MSPSDGDDPDDDATPEFGPSGYLPQRASQRARKIVLRAPLGVQWVWAAIVAGAIVLVAGVLFLARADDGPGAPYRAVAALDEIGNGEVRTIEGHTVLFVTEGGRPRAFDVTSLDDRPIFCPGSRRLEAPGRVWSLTGRGLGTASLSEFPTLVSRGLLYLDPTAAEPGPPARDAAEVPACVT